ncbi:NACHT domain-containing protein, partial [Diplogelasinospora grovesii]
MAVILSAKDTISSAIQAVPHAALAWTGVCIALEVLANPLYATEANRQGISHVVNRMDWYWSLSSSALKESSGDDGELAAVRLELENNAVHLYKTLLSYQMKSVCSYYRNRGVVFLQDLVHVDDWNGELHAVLAAESRFQQDSNVYTNQQTTCHLQNLVNHAGKQEMAQNSEKDEECLRALRLTDPNDDKKRIQATKGGLLKDSYCWVLRNSEFRLWRDDPERSLLWIKGDPGKGKTMLLCGIVDELRNATGNPCPVTVSFFFCQAPLDRLNNATAVLRGLIYQLATNQPSLISHVRKKYDHAGKKLFEDVNAWVALSEVFFNIVQDPALRTAFLVIDALDECVTGLRELLDFIVTASDRYPHVKWIVSSRNWPQIGEHLRMLPKSCPQPFPASWVGRCCCGFDLGSGCARCAAGVHGVLTCGGAPAGVAIDKNGTSYAGVFFLDPTLIDNASWIRS